MRIIEFVVAFALLVASFWAMAAAFLPEYVGFEMIMFTLGLIFMTLSFWLPMRRIARS